MKISKIAITLLCAATLAFVGCGDKDEKKKGDEAAKPADGDKTPAAGTPAPAADKAPAAAGATPTDGDMEKAWGIMQGMAAAAKDNKGDCGKMAAGLEKVFADNGDTIKKMNSMKDDAAMQAKWDAKYKAESEKLMMAMMGDIGECMKDPKLQAAMAKMDGK